MKKYILIVILSLSYNLFSQTTYVPDDIFEAYLETHDANGNIVAVGSSTSMGNGISNDNYVTTANINTVTTLNVSGLGISDLTGIEDFTDMDDLNFSNNAISTVNLSQLTSLRLLKCNNNNLTSLNVFDNISLSEINCSNNQLTTLHLNNNFSLVKVDCSANQINDFNINFIVNYLYGGYNPKIEILNCSNNNLSQLDLLKMESNNITSFNATTNPNLTCIQIDNPNTPSTPTWQKDPIASYSTNCHYNETYVPDDNFEKYFETHDANGNTVTVGDPNSMGNGIYNDDYVLTSRINTVTNLVIGPFGITDLTGIEDFTSLQTLDVSLNNLTSVNLSQNTALTHLMIYLCNLSSLDVSSNTALTHLECFSNNISSLNIGTNTALTYLDCSGNNLTSLNLNQNTALTYLDCNSNQLSSLDVSQNTNLTYLDSSENQITYLNISQNSALTKLYCFTNQLTSLSVYYNNNLQLLACGDNQISNLILPNVKTNLINIAVSNTQLTSLDISDYPNVNSIFCDNNQLQQLNVKNGNNTNIFNNNFDATNNPNLTCIEVDDATWSTANWTNIDATASFSNNCNFNETNVPDDNFEAYLETHDANGNVVPLGDPNSMGNGIANDNFVTTANINTVTTLNVSNLNISNLIGIEDFTALQVLNCSNNNLTDLITDQNTSLIELDCSYNQISSLGVAPTTIQKVICNDNNMNVLVVNPATLKYLYCQNNNYQVLDLQYMYNLIEVNCSNNQLSSLSVINSAGNLTKLNISNNNFTGIDVSNNPNLQILDCSNNQITNAGFNLQSQTNLLALNCSNNLLTQLDVSQATLLEDLTCNDNQLSSLDLSQNTSLITLICDNNQIANILSPSNSLMLLNCSNNQLTALDITQNTQLSDFDCSNNQIGNLDFSANTQIQRIACDANQLNQLDVSQNSQLIILTCNNNPTLTNISMANGNNINITNFQANNNQYLACIEVDDISIPNSPVWQKDDNASYSENCTLKTKIWENGQWTNGAPTITDIAIIRDNYNTSSAGNIEAKTITIDSGYNLNIQSGNYLKIAQNTIYNGNIYIYNTGSYVQVNDLAKNLGNGIFKVAIQTTSLDDEHRFTYFSSPVESETLQVFSSWAKMNYIWDFDTAIQDWNILNGNETMQTITGYAVEPSATNSFPFQALTEFTGKPHNGSYSTSLVFNPGGVDDDNKLIGNPYPSAIDATMLLNQNSGANAFYFWTHKSALGATGYLGDDYAVWNNSGGVASTSGSPAPTGFIASGQGFFVTATANGNLTFNNGMRVTGNNNDFRRPNTNESKLWLNLTNNNQYFSQVLIAFSENGTDDFDPTYDAVRLNSGSEIRFYSIGNNNEQFAIETFGNLTEDKTVKLGIETQQIGKFAFKIDHYQNLENIQLYLKDHLLNILFNLRAGNYEFNIDQLGTINNRFELVFVKNNLSVDNQYINDLLSVYQNFQNELVFDAIGNEKIESIKIYDLLGKTLLKRFNINNKRDILNHYFKTGEIIFIATKLYSGKIIHSKIYIKNY